MLKLKLSSFISLFKIEYKTLLRQIKCAHTYADTCSTRISNNIQVEDRESKCLKSELSFYKKSTVSSMSINVVEEPRFFLFKRTCFCFRRHSSNKTSADGKSYNLPPTPSKNKCKENVYNLTSLIIDKDELIKIYQ